MNILLAAIEVTDNSVYFLFAITVCASLAGFVEALF